MAHFEPDTITLIGEGVFPRISFNLPRDVTHENYSRLRKRALEKLTPAEGPVEGDTANKDSQDKLTVSGWYVAGAYLVWWLAISLYPHPQLLVPPHDLECEIERLMVVEVAQEHSDKMRGVGRKPSRPRRDIAT